MRIWFIRAYGAARDLIFSKFEIKMDWPYQTHPRFEPDGGTLFLNEDDATEAVADIIAYNRGCGMFKRIELVCVDMTDLLPAATVTVTTLWPEENDDE